MLCGLDRAAGGTWLGISKTGRIALLTNIAEAVPSPTLQDGRPRPSRGALVTDFLCDASETNPLDFARERLDNFQDYAGFNLVLATLSPTTAQKASFSVLSNRSSPTLATTTVDPPAHSLAQTSVSSSGCVSNGIFVNDPQNAGQTWPKVSQGYHSFNQLINTNIEGNDRARRDELLKLLTYAFSIYPSVKERPCTWSEQ